MVSAIWILPAAFVLDLFAGDPVYALHPVRLAGRLINWLERHLRRGNLAGFLGGTILLVATNCVMAAGYILLRWIAGRIHPAAVWTLDVFALYSCIALKDLHDHARPVALALGAGNLPAARDAVARMVGRDVTVLDAPGVARAAVESVAESFPDGFLAPVFWYTVFATTGSAEAAVLAALVYRTTNTLDSMVGHRNEKYEWFGKASARVDDVLNFIPARISIPFLWAAAVLIGWDAREGRRVAWRDRLKHESPNSAHAESFMAGALGLKLGGPTAYADGIVEKPWLGNGTDSATVEHIMAACRLIFYAGTMAVIAAWFLLWSIGYEGIGDDGRAGALPSIQNPVRVTASWRAELPAHNAAHSAAGGPLCRELKREPVLQRGGQAA